MSSLEQFYNIILISLTKLQNMSSSNLILQSQQSLTESLLSAQSKLNSSCSTDLSGLWLKSENRENLKSQTMGNYGTNHTANEEPPEPIRNQRSNQRSQKIFSILNHALSEDQDKYSLDETAPKSRQTQFQFQNANPSIARQVSHSNILDFLDRHLRKQMGKKQRKDIYKKMTSSSHRSRSSCQNFTILSKQQAIGVLQLFQLILRIGQQIKLQQLLDLLQKLVSLYNSQSQQSKKQILLKVLTLTNHAESLFAIRMYQVLVVIVHIFPIERATGIFILKVLEERLKQGNKRLNEQEYVRFLAFYLFRKIQCKQCMTYPPIKYQLSCLIFLRQIQIPCYLPIGHYVLVHAEPYETFSDIKKRTMQCFGINSHRYCKQLFQFTLLLQRDSNIILIPIDQGELCWDYLSYMHYLKEQFSVIGKTNLSILLKLTFPLKTASDDADSIEILFANYFLEYILGNIEVGHSSTMKMIAAINVIKYQSSSEFVFPNKYNQLFQEAESRKQIDDWKKYYKGFDRLRLKYIFISICNEGKTSLGLLVSTRHEFCVQLRQNHMIYVGEGDITLKDIDLITIENWQVNGYSLTLHFFDPNSRGLIIISENSNIIAAYLRNRICLLNDGLV